MNLLQQNIETKTVMDQIAWLVFVAENVISFGPTISKSAAYSDAESEARKIVEYVEAVTAELLAALLHTPKKRKPALRVAYKNANVGYDAAYSSAMNLVEMEKAATGGQGKIIAGGTVSQLRKLKEFWNSGSTAIAT